MNQTFDTIKLELFADGILQITLSRPDKLNALNAQVLNELSQVFSQAKTDDTIKALLLTGEGKAFCAGADINRLQDISAEEGYAFAKQGQQVFRQLEMLGKPSIAAINGFAFGGGCELAMSASLRIAATTAQFGQPEVKLGVIPGYGGTQRLARLIGKGRAIDLCLTGRFIKADQALQWGLVTQLVEPEALMEHSLEQLKTILAMGPLAIRSVLETMHHGYELSMEQALELEASHFALTCASQDRQEGVSAFLEKRVAEFKGQ